MLSTLAHCSQSDKAFVLQCDLNVTFTPLEIDQSGALAAVEAALVVLIFHFSEDVFAAVLPPRALTTQLHNPILTPHLHLSPTFAPASCYLKIRTFPPCSHVLNLPSHMQVNCYAWPADCKVQPSKCWGTTGFRRMCSSLARGPKMTLLW